MGAPRNSVTAKGAAERFHGDVWIDQLVPAGADTTTRVGLVRFAPGARTAWHRHAHGQTLHVVDGVCLVQTLDSPVVVAVPGESIWTPADEWHWHGATPDRFMSHFAIWQARTGHDAGRDSQWGEHIDDDDYVEAAHIALRA
ncbi:MAG: cupin domain-containing protein [Actinomycetota bacterium]|nr:cupin domain-containing protein [Actinomycetota bacterium]